MKSYQLYQKLAIGAAALVVAGASLDAKELLFKSRIPNRAFNQLVDLYPDQTCRVAGKADTAKMNLDSVRITQSVNGTLDTTFRLFGQIDVTLQSHTDGRLVLRTDSGQTLTLQDGQVLPGYPDWTVNLSDSGTRLKIEAYQKFDTTKTLNLGDTLRGPFGLDVSPLHAPPYAQLFLTPQATGYTLSATTGEVRFACPVWYGSASRDTRAANNPIAEEDIYYYRNGRVVPETEFVFAQSRAEPANDGYYHRAQASDPFVVTDWRGSTNIRGPPAHLPARGIWIGPGADSTDRGQNIYRGLGCDDSTSMPLTLHVRADYDENRRTYHLSASFDLYRSGTPIQTGLTTHLSPFDSFNTTISNDTLWIVYNGRDGNNDLAFFGRAPAQDTGRVGVEERAAKDLDMLRLYPNPVKDELMIRRAGEGRATLTIFNVLGQTVGEFRALEGENRIRLRVDTLPAGLYLLRAKNSDGSVESQEFVKE